MRLLLDTPILLWCLGDVSKLGSQMRMSIEDTDNEVFVSAVSAWEIADLQSRDSLILPGPVEEWLLDAVAELDATWLPLSPEQALLCRSLPWHHDDPYDRPLIAQAATGYRLATADRRFEPYPISVLWN